MQRPAVPEVRLPLAVGRAAANVQVLQRSGGHAPARLLLRDVTLASDFKCQDRGKGKGHFEVPNSHFPELFRARSRLYRSHILQVNTRWKALVEIYTMHSFAPFWNRIPKYFR